MQSMGMQHGTQAVFPALADKPTFEYQSCTNLPLGSSGSMAGHFTFVEGSIANPTGPAFEVEVIPHGSQTLLITYHR